MLDVWSHLGSMLGSRLIALGGDVKLGVHLLVAPPKSASRDLESVHLLLYPRYPVIEFLPSPQPMEFYDILFYVSDDQGSIELCTDPQKVQRHHQSVSLPIHPSLGNCPLRTSHCHWQATRALA
jgi:hypothetical protein